MLRRLIALLTTAAFVVSNFSYAQAQTFSVNQLPVPGALIGESAPSVPLSLKGLIVDPQKPLQFQFLVDTGRGPQNTAYIREESNRLVKYFLAGLTIPEGELWVNLSPYEKSRMTTVSLGQTLLGRDLLAQDYILKQLTASLIYPEKALGKEFWSRVYARAQQEFGTTSVPVNTFNKVWILPDEAQVYENGPAAYITKATLKVMLDEDYLALQKHGLKNMSSPNLPNLSSPNALIGDPNTTNTSHTIASQIVRQIVLPEITKEVNFGRNFAPLRQIYDAMILAKWYKETIQNTLLDAVYTNKKKIAGVNLADPSVKEQIYQRYLQAYKKGVFNYIKEDAAPDGQLVPRKYFSGGEVMVIHLEENGSESGVRADGAMISLKVVVGGIVRSLHKREMTKTLNALLYGNEGEFYREIGRLISTWYKTGISPIETFETLDDALKALQDKLGRQKAPEDKGLKDLVLEEKSSFGITSRRLVIDKIIREIKEEDTQNAAMLSQMPSLASMAAVPDRAMFNQAIQFLQNHKFLSFELAAVTGIAVYEGYRGYKFWTLNYTVLANILLLVRGDHNQVQVATQRLLVAQQNRVDPAFYFEVTQHLLETAGLWAESEQNERGRIQFLLRALFPDLRKGNLSAFQGRITTIRSIIEEIKTRQAKEDAAMLDSNEVLSLYNSTKEAVDFLDHYKNFVLTVLAVPIGGGFLIARLKALNDSQNSRNRAMLSRWHFLIGAAAAGLYTMAKPKTLFAQAPISESDKTIQIIDKIKQSKDQNEQAKGFYILCSARLAEADNRAFDFVNRYLGQIGKKKIDLSSDNPIGAQILNGLLFYHKNHPESDNIEHKMNAPFKEVYRVVISLADNAQSSNVLKNPFEMAEEILSAQNERSITPAKIRRLGNALRLADLLIPRNKQKRVSTEEIREEIPHYGTDKADFIRALRYLSASDQENAGSAALLMLAAQKLADPAALAKQPPGGIDLNQIAIKRTGKTIPMRFDPAQLKSLMSGGDFAGFSPEIIAITPVSNPLSLLNRKELQRL